MAVYFESMSVSILYLLLVSLRLGFSFFCDQVFVMAK